MKRFTLLLLIVITICTGFYFYKSKKDNWDTLTINGKQCGMEGTAQKRDDKDANRLKNRWIMPKNKDFDSNFTWNILFGENDENPKKYSPNKAARITGYVAYISKSGKETCNCGYKEPEFHDYHINLVVDTSYYQDKTQHLIVEITPRLREIMKAQGIDWNLNALKKIRHKRIEVEGWLFYDWEHGDKAYLRTGDTVKSWRATCWEIHPITSLKVLD
jgi:hypothetical protein